MQQKAQEIIDEARKKTKHMTYLKKKQLADILRNAWGTSNVTNGDIDNAVENAEGKISLAMNYLHNLVKCKHEVGNIKIRELELWKKLKLDWKDSNVTDDEIDNVVRRFDSEIDANELIKASVLQKK